MAERVDSSVSPGPASGLSGESGLGTLTIIGLSHHYPHPGQELWPMNLPTFITALRILIAPIFAYVFIHGYRIQSVGWLWAAITLAVAIELTDTLDGRVARAQGLITDFGKIFDPMADSLSRQTVIISFMIVGIIPLWMYLIFLYRDAVLSTLRIIIAYSGTVQAAKKSGKLKAVLQGAGIFLVLLVVLTNAYTADGFPRLIAGHHPGFWIMLFPAIFTVLSAFDYLIPNWPAVQKMMTPKR